VSSCTVVWETSFVPNYCTIIMNQLEWISDINPSGVLDMECAPYQLLIGKAREFAIGDLLLTDGSPWLKIYFTLATKSYTEKEVNGDHGKSYQIEASGFFPGDSVLIRNRLESMKQHRWVLRMRDNAGIRRRIGMGREALDFVTDFKVDPAMAGERGYLFQWSGLLSQRPMVIS
jgi:hypothetical protein